MWTCLIVSSTSPLGGGISKPDWILTHDAGLWVLCRYNGSIYVICTIVYNILLTLSSTFMLCMCGSFKTSFKAFGLITILYFLHMNQHRCGFSLFDCCGGAFLDGGLIGAESRPRWNVPPGGNTVWSPPAEHPVVLTQAYQLHMGFLSLQLSDIFSCLESVSAGRTGPMSRGSISQTHTSYLQQIKRLLLTTCFINGCTTTCHNKTFWMTQWIVLGPLSLSLPCHMTLSTTWSRLPRILWENISGSWSRTSNTAATPLKSFLWQKENSAKKARTGPSPSSEDSSDMWKILFSRAKFQGEDCDFRCEDL